MKRKRNKKRNRDLGDSRRIGVFTRREDEGILKFAEECERGTVKEAFEASESPPGTFEFCAGKQEGVRFVAVVVHEHNCEDPDENGRMLLGQWVRSDADYDRAEDRIAGILALFLKRKKDTCKQMLPGRPAWN